MFNPKKDAVTYSLADLKKIKDGGLAPTEALETLRREADKYVERESIVVTKRPMTAPSGNPHDYMSMGIYWWPNPDTPTGLPYVRRDGYVNPEAKSEHSPGAVAILVYVCSLAAFYFDEEKYAKRAEKAIYDWYINPDTYMTPHAKYAQAIPGICDGRGTGLIDFSSSYLVMDGVRLLEAMGMIDEHIVLGVEDWFYKFTDWMLTSETAFEEDNDGDNHGCWFDSQIITAAAFTGRPQLLRKIATSTYDRRFKKQIMPDGSMPKELRRTQGIGYTFYAIKALITLAKTAKRAGYTELVSPDESRGGNILLKQAFDFIAPYAIDPSTFPLQEIHPDTKPSELGSVALKIAPLFPEAAYPEKYKEYIKPDTFDWLVP